MPSIRWRAGERNSKPPSPENAAQGRMFEPEEVAAATLFLASDEASFVNGAHRFVDNGFTAV